MFADDDAECPHDDHDDDDDSGEHDDDDDDEDADDDDDDEGADDQLPTHLWAQLLVEPFSAGRRNNGKQGKQQIPGNITNS